MLRRTPPIPWITKSRTRKEDLMDRNESPSGSDPIAQNPKDTHDAPQGIQRTDVIRKTDALLAEPQLRQAGQPSASSLSIATPTSPMDLFASLLRYKWTMILVAMLTSISLITAVWMLYVPKHKAKAEIRIRPIIPRLVFRTDENGAIPFYASFVNTQVAIMRSPTVLQRVLDQQAVLNTQWYQSPSQSPVQRLLGNPPTPALERLGGALSVRPRRRTEIMDVSLTDSNAKDAAIIVNTVLDQYIKYIGERADASEDDLYRKLVEQYRALENEILGREKICAELRKSMGTEVPQVLVATKRMRLDETRNRLNDLKNRMALLSWDRQKLTELISSTSPEDGNSVASSASAADAPQLHDNADELKYATLNNNLQAIQFHITALVATLGTSGNRAVQIEEARIHLEEVKHRIRVLEQNRQEWAGLLKQLPIPDRNDTLPGRTQIMELPSLAAANDLETELRNIRNHLDALTLSLLTNNTPDPAIDPDIASTMKQVTLAEIQQHAISMEGDWTVFRNRLSYILTATGNSIGPATAWEKPRHYHEDVEWRNLDVNLRALQHQLNISLYGPRHPERQRLLQNIQFAREMLKLREIQLDEAWLRQSRPNMYTATAVESPLLSFEIPDPDYQGQLKALNLQLERYKLEEKLLKADYEQQQTEFKEIMESAQLLEKESTALKHKRKLFGAVRDRRDQKNMERNVAGSIEILTNARVSSRPTQDRRLVFTAMALFMGLGMGGGVAFLRASRDRAIRAVSDIPMTSYNPFLGCVPLIRSYKTMAYENHPAVTESVRSLRTALLSRLENQENPATILVTSANEGTGKSSFTLMLGRSLIQAGKKVLIIDGDPYKKTLSKRFDLHEEAGFRDLLIARGNSINNRIMATTDIPDLKIMPAGHVDDTHQPFDEICNGAFETYLDKIGERFQYGVILIDSPPLLAVADAAIMAGKVHGAILVERELISDRDHILHALDRLTAAGGQLLGTVFLSSGKYEGSNGYQYGYGNNGYGNSDGYSYIMATENKKRKTKEQAKHKRKASTSPNP